MKNPPPNRRISLSSCHGTAIALLFSIFSCAPSNIFAQVTAPLTKSGLNTQVSGALNVGGNTQYNITGGTRPSNGGNVFHSFGEFGVPLNNIANFQNDAGLPTTNILSRVTGNNPSNILGTIRTEGFSDANLFLLNPNGVVFGPNASLDLNGSFHVSTADSIQLGTATGDGLFSANDPMLDMLTSAPPSAFGFSGSNPLTGIAVENATLAVAPGKVISIIGGATNALQPDEAQGNQIEDGQEGVLISASTISAPGGQINLVSVAAPGTVTTSGPELTPVFPLSGFTELGQVKVSGENSRIDVRGNSRGAVVIRGGRLSLDNRAQINASTSGASDAGTVTINVSENVVVAGTGIQEPTQSGIFSKTTGLAEGAGNGGNITVTAQNVEVKDGGQVSTSTEGRGAAGTIRLATTGGDVVLSGSDNRTGSLAPTRESTLGSGLFSSTAGSGNAGTVTVESRNLEISKGALIAAQTVGRGNGDAGTVTITSEGTVSIFGLHANSDASSSIFASVSEGGNTPGLLGSGGTINISSQTLELKDGGKINVKSSGTNQGNVENLLGPNEQLPTAGTVDIRTGSLLVTGANITGALFPIDPSEISAGVTGPASAGTIIVDADNVTVSNGGLISAETQSSTKITNTRGSISITAHENLNIFGAAERTDFSNLNNYDLKNNIVNDSLTTSLSGIRARTSGVNQAGDILVRAKNLDISEGGQITSSVLSAGTGEGGMLTVKVEDTLQISGAYNFSNRDTVPLLSGITSFTLGSGKAGDINVTARNVILNNGAEISSGTTGRGSGNAGNLTIGTELSPVENLTLLGIASVKNSEPGTPPTNEISSKISSSVSESSTKRENFLLGSGGTINIVAGKVDLKDGATIEARSSGDIERFESSAFREIISNTPTVDLPRAGNIDITANDLIVSGAKKIGGSKTFSISPSGIITGVTGPAGTGNITVKAMNITVAEGGIISSETESLTPRVQRGSIDLTASGTLSVTGFALRETFPPEPRETFEPSPADLENGRTITQSGILARTSGTNQAGDITIKGNNVGISQGGRIENSAIDSFLEKAGDAGTINIIVGNNLALSGAVPFTAPTILFKERSSTNIPMQLPSTISSTTDGAGNAGQIVINAKNIGINGGARIEASALQTTETISRFGEIALPVSGRAGEIMLTATELLTMNGVSNLPGTANAPSSILSTSEGPGLGGTITITSDVIDLQEGARISTSATSSGQAGNIILQNANEILLEGATLETASTRSSGGDITLVASDLIFLKDSLIRSSVEGDGSTQGGNINIDPEFIVLLSSQIEANAEKGFGGNISLVGNVIFTDFLTTIRASAGPAGVDGTVNIQAPIQNLSQAIAPLPEGLIEVAALYSAQCAGQKGGLFSSFTQQGRDRIPYEPGELLPTPLFTPDLTPDQSKKPNTFSSPMVQRLQLPSFDSAAYLVSTWNISRGGCSS